MFAVINGHYDLAGFLVDQGADVNRRSRGHDPALCGRGHAQHAAPVRPAEPDPIVVAASLDAMRMLLAHGANVNAGLKGPILKRGYNAGDRQLNDGATPLMRAAKGADLAAMRVLLESGADPARPQKNGTTALMLAAGIRARTDEGGVPVPEAARAIEAMEMLLGRGVDVNAANAAGIPRRTWRFATFRR
jgi:ankyrin repeat protein